MYTLSSWRSHLGIVVVDLSHQEYPRVMLDPRAINKSAGFQSPGFLAKSARNPHGIRDESARNPPCLPGFSAGIRPESAMNPPGFRAGSGQSFLTGFHLRYSLFLFNDSQLFILSSTYELKILYDRKIRWNPEKKVKNGVAGRPNRVLYYFDRFNLGLEKNWAEFYEPKQRKIPIRNVCLTYRGCFRVNSQNREMMRKTGVLTT